ncbi:energy-coupling factor ABC transporter permease [Rheinheimera sp. 1928-s]|uniref:energy-coupling factor ABC transporter permease n=1 Tax=Rheinheimera sp. 1928-s TaxID=3033803 RepID=UPI00261DD6F0|nr:energy-coupling factor ABC transporter permease [Rheinheimera sp. 1928-s]MDF3125577.1 energy-coupling factor ABC transporter permease [Rheinheimera sp. 1928-s]
MLAAFCLLLFAGLVFSRDFWRELPHKSVPWPVAGASVCVLALLWQTDAAVLDALPIHFLALTTLMLLFGLRLSCLLFVLVMALQWLMSTQSLEQLLWTLVCGWLVLALNYGVYLFCFHYVQRHLFIYLFIGAFLNSALGLVVFMLLQAWYQADQYSAHQLYDSYLIFIPLAALPEALLNGMAMTLLVIYKPEWVYTYYQRIYLSGK